MRSLDSGPCDPRTRDFWSAGPGLENFDAKPMAADDPAALCRLLGPLPGDRDGAATEALRRIYAHLADEAEREAFASEHGGPSR